MEGLDSANTHSQFWPELLRTFFFISLVFTALHTLLSESIHTSIHPSLPPLRLLVILLENSSFRARLEESLVNVVRRV